MQVGGINSVGLQVRLVLLNHPNETLLRLPQRELSIDNLVHDDAAVLPVRVKTFETCFARVSHLLMNHREKFDLILPASGTPKFLRGFTVNRLEIPLIEPMMKLRDRSIGQTIVVIRTLA
jgi:hypothetical protein